MTLTQHMYNSLSCREYSMIHTGNTKGDYGTELKSDIQTQLTHQNITETPIHALQCLASL